jgi:uncharacterized repeat protein (TIGR03803 family)
MELDGGNYSVLHHFAGKDLDDGSLPLGQLLEAGGGFLYGTTYNGGNGSDLGTIFKMNTNGTGYAVLHSFQGGASDGSLAVAGLSQAMAGGMLYGTAPHGGIADGGMVFALNVDGGSYSSLHTFNSAGGDGTFPFAGLLAGSDGALYGATYFGGIYTTNGTSGVLFRLFSDAPQIRITSLIPGSTGVALQFTGAAAGQTCRIQAAADPFTGGWQVIGTNSAAIDGTLSFFDAAAANYPARFYRGVSP